MQMPVKFEVSVMQVGASLRITVPKEVAAHLGLAKGSKVTMWVDNSHAVMEKKKGPGKILRAGEGNLNG